jgi:hypothetical protein
VLDDQGDVVAVCSSGHAEHDVEGDGEGFDVIERDGE